MIYLRVSPEAAMERMGAFLSARPLLDGGNPLDRLRRLYDDRSEQYRRADLEVDTEVLDLQAVIDRVQRYAVS
jgi:shikimate kinase